MKAKFLIEMEAGPTAPTDHPGIIDEGGKRFWTVGAVIDHPDCFKLVHGGICEAADDECSERVKQMDPERAGVLRRVNERIRREQEEFRAELEAAEEEDDEDESYA